MRLGSLSRCVFAGTLIAQGIVSFARGDFAGAWEPEFEGVPNGLSYLCGAVALGCGIGMIVPRAAATAARFFLAFLFLWFLIFKIPMIVNAPLEEAAWLTCGETIVILSATWIAYRTVAADWDRQRLGFLVGDRGLRIAQILYGLALLSFGGGHFRYLGATASLVPAFLPAHFVWAVFTGGAYIAAGVSMIVGILPRLASVLMVAQMASFTFLIWGPVLIEGPKNEFAWSEIVISWVLTISAWVIADSYRDLPWLSLRKQGAAK